jgi:hypothetical protein
MAKKQSKNQSSRYSRCHITAAQACDLSNDSHALAEGFWITLINDDLAKVENILLCGLGVGDIIRVRSGDCDSGEHTNEFVEIVQRKSNVVFMRYALHGYDTLPDKFPSDARAFIEILTHLNIKCEAMMPGMLAIQYPLIMSEDKFLDYINSGPFVFMA